MAWENPERAWERPAQIVSVDRREIEGRIGAFTGPIEVFAGGLANLNVRVANSVLRIYRRDPSVAKVEASLLRNGWTSFRVPSVLEEGSDFLLLEYVPHEAIEGTAEQGAAVGRALAEIHSKTFDLAGLLGPDLEVAKAYPSFLETLREYASTEMRAGPLAHHHDHLMEALQGLKVGPPTLLHGDWKGSNLHWADGRLLVLDWEFAYSGAALLDVGQLLRWPPPQPFIDTFAESYGRLPEDWRLQADLFDLANLAGLSARAAPRTRCAQDVEARILKTIGASR